jgi:hypothetical protein
VSYASTLASIKNVELTLVKSTTPVHGDLIVFAGGVCGAARPLVCETAWGASGHSQLSHGMPHALDDRSH